MVCEKCEKKLGSMACPDPWKDGARTTDEGGARKLNENKALSSKKNKFQPYAKINKCRICKQAVHQAHAHYCSGCAYKVGICAMCGKQIADTKSHAMTMV